MGDSKGEGVGVRVLRAELGVAEEVPQAYDDEANAWCNVANFGVHRRVCKSRVLSRIEIQILLAPGYDLVRERIGCESWDGEIGGI